MDDETFHEKQPAPDHERDKQPRRVGELTARVAERVKTFEEELRELTRLDDDQLWAERDARVRRQIQAEEGKERARDRVQRAHTFKSAPHNFPARAIDDALAVWPAETPAMGHARKWAALPKLVQVLAGGTGTGKTSAAAWLALEPDIGGSRPLFIRAGELEARGRYDKDLRDDLRAASFLVIDDIGTEVLDGKGVLRALLDEVVDMFYGDRKRLVLSTNLKKRREEKPDGTIDIHAPAQFSERYGARLMSRLIEVGEWSGCGDVDLRRGRS